MRKDITPEMIENGCRDVHSMREAAVKLGLPFMTFKAKAIKFGFWKPNNGRKGVLQWTPARLLESDFDRLSGQQKRRRLLIEQENKCAVCAVGEIWNGLPLKLQCDHIDGNRKNEVRENLRMICPNCHSQTPTFGSKNASPEGRLRMATSKKKNASLKGTGIPL